MKKYNCLLSLIIIIGLFSGCQSKTENCQIAATTLPVYEFTSILCAGTNLKVSQIVTESVSCLHDYTLQTSQMRLLESAQTVVCSGGGLEDFLDDALSSKDNIVDASQDIELLCGEEHHDHSHSHSHSHSHTHEQDPHYWLSPEKAKLMAKNICNGLTLQYPQYTDQFSCNLEILTNKLDSLQAYGEQALSDLSCRELITFHDGFSYFAEAFNLSILKAIEEESGSEASAAELKELIALVGSHNLPAIFTETNGSDSAAKIISSETDATIFALDMAISAGSYFDAMYHNINTVKEALG